METSRDSPFKEELMHSFQEHDEILNHAVDAKYGSNRSSVKRMTLYKNKSPGKQDTDLVTLNPQLQLFGQSTERLSVPIKKSGQKNEKSITHRILENEFMAADVAVGGSSEPPSFSELNT